MLLYSSLFKFENTCRNFFSVVHNQSFTKDYELRELIPHTYPYYNDDFSKSTFSARSCDAIF